MASFNVLSSLMRIGLQYQNEEGNDATRSVSIGNINPSATADCLKNVADAVSAILSDEVTTVKSVVTSLIGD